MKKARETAKTQENEKKTTNGRTGSGKKRFERKKSENEKQNEKKKKNKTENERKQNENENKKRRQNENEKKKKKKKNGTENGNETENEEMKILSKERWNEIAKRTMKGRTKTQISSVASSFPASSCGKKSMKTSVSTWRTLTKTMPL